MCEDCEHYKRIGETKCPDCGYNLTLLDGVSREETVAAPVNGSETRRKTLEKRVTGALRSCLAAHGPITKYRIGSAAKRIVSQLMAESQNEWAAALGRARVAGILMNNHHSYCECQECRDKRHIAQLKRELIELSRERDALRKFAQRVEPELEAELRSTIADEHRFKKGSPSAVWNEGYKDGLRKAIEAHRSHSGLRWTAEKPAAEGWWWYEQSIVGMKIPHVLLVSKNRDGQFGLYRAEYDKWEAMVNEMPGRWAGPLPEPQEAPDEESSPSVRISNDAP